jgi:hypothetical protein
MPDARSAYFDNKLQNQSIRSYGLLSMAICRLTNGSHKPIII